MSVKIVNYYNSGCTNEQVKCFMSLNIISTFRLNQLKLLSLNKNINFLKIKLFRNSGVEESLVIFRSRRKNKNIDCLKGCFLFPFTFFF